MDSRICLIRHGITEGNKNRLYYGHSDIPLAEEGIKELRRLAASGIYPDGDEADFYTTGLRRTEQTLELIYGPREHRVIKNLMEIDFGDFEMKSYEQLRELEEYKIWMADKKGELSPPNGESRRGFYQRVVEGFGELKALHQLKCLSMRHRSEDALSVAVCHGGTISVILDSIYPGVKDNFYRWIPEPGHGYILSMKDDKVIDTEMF